MSEESVQVLIDHVVDGIPGVIGALISSVDGFVIASRLPPDSSLDPSAIAAMSAAMMALSTRLVQLGGAAPATRNTHRSPEAQVCVFAVGDSAALTIIADHTAHLARIEIVGDEVSQGLAGVLDN